MSSQLDTTDYTSTERIDGDVWCKFSVETMREMQKELDNRNPQTFGLKTTPDFFKLAEIEVIENQLRVVMKHYKNANKKKSPFSAWKSVFAHLEALTLFLQSKDSWATTEYATPESKKRALDVYNAYGAAWISTAEKLVGMASFSEGFLPSVRSAVKAALALGTSLAERFPKTKYVITSLLFRCLVLCGNSCRKHQPVARQVGVSLDGNAHDRGETEAVECGRRSGRGLEEKGQEEKGEG
ncbi:hypothetical protein DFJ73DRAFT_810314 [Zopfochytrium polystomum]|nr:hypothetical protein DFJ73DRAFT_810314 [Zopfochytrium polystomum]